MLQSGIRPCEWGGIALERDKDVFYDVNLPLPTSKAFNPIMFFKLSRKKMNA